MGTATVGIPPRYPNPALAALLARGYARVPSLNPLRTKNIAEEFTEFAGARWASVGAKATWQTPPATQAGGFVRSTDTVDVISRGWVTPSSGTLLVTLDEVTPFWSAFGFRVPTAVAGNINVFGFGVPTAAPAGCFVGYDGGGSTTKYSGYTFNGASVDRTLSTVNVDGGIHTGEVWSTGGLFFLSIDNEAPVLMTHTHLFTSQLCTLDWVYAGSGPNPIDVFWRAAIWPVSYAV